MRRKRAVVLPTSRLELVDGKVLVVADTHAPSSLRQHLQAMEGRPLSFGRDLASSLIAAIHDVVCDAAGGQLPQGPAVGLEHDLRAVNVTDRAARPVVDAVQRSRRACAARRLCTSSRSRQAPRRM
jgi:hypothetical protein